MTMMTMSATDSIPSSAVQYKWFIMQLRSQNDIARCRALGVGVCSNSVSPPSSIASASDGSPRRATRRLCSNDNISRLGVNPTRRLLTALISCSLYTSSQRKPVCTAENDQQMIEQRKDGTYTPFPQLEQLRSMLLVCQHRILRRMSGRSIRCSQGLWGRALSNGVWSGLR